MEFEDSRNALFCDPNAYIQKVEKRDKCKARKVVFQEPYEQLPNFYLDNNFKCRDCDCVSNKNNSNNHDCKYNHGNGYSNNRNCHDANCHNDNSNKEKNFGFDFKNLMPLLALFNKGGGADFLQITNLLNNNTDAGNNSNPMNLISTLLSNKDGLTNILNLFKGGGLNLFNKKQPNKKELKTTDFQIKNYTRVE